MLAFFLDLIAEPLRFLVVRSHFVQSFALAFQAALFGCVLPSHLFLAKLLAPGFINVEDASDMAVFRVVAFDLGLFAREVFFDKLLVLSLFALVGLLDVFFDLLFGDEFVVLASELLFEPVFSSLDLVLGQGGTLEIPGGNFHLN